MMLVQCRTGLPAIQHLFKSRRIEITAFRNVDGLLDAIAIKVDRGTRASVEARYEALQPAEASQALMDKCDSQSWILLTAEVVQDGQPDALDVDSVRAPPPGVAMADALENTNQSTDSRSISDATSRRQLELLRSLWEDKLIDDEEYRTRRAVILDNLA